MRFLCLSDIHGHAEALNRVLTSADDWGYDQLIVCGDLCFPGPEPLKVWRTLVDRHALCVQGLSDRALSELDPSNLRAISPKEKERLARLSAQVRELGELTLARLARLPTVAHLSLECGLQMTIVHGSPADPTEAITFDMTDEEVARLVGDDPCDVLLCGASHVPFQRQLEGLRVISTGSVGESPTPGVAHATIITSTPLDVAVAQYEVPLD